MPAVAQTVNNLAVLYSRRQRLREAEATYQEAVEISRELAKENPAAYQPHVAGTLGNLALLFGDTQRKDEAETALRDRRAGRRNPSSYFFYYRKARERERMRAGGPRPPGAKRPDLRTTFRKT